MGRRIVIASGKGGVGKTTIVAGLGTMLASLGASVVMIDADAGLSNLDTLMNVQNKVVFDISDVLKSKCRIKQALLPHKHFDNLFTIASSKTDIGDELDDSVKFEEVTTKLASVFDFVLIDAPAGASLGFKTALAGADEALIVVTPHTSSLRDADKVISVISSSMQSVKLIVNRIRGDLVLSNDMLSHSDIQTLFSKKVIGVIPERDYVNIYSSLNFNIFMDKQLEKSFYLLADNIFNGKNKIYDYKKQYRGLFGLIKRKMKRA